MKWPGWTDSKLPTKKGGRSVIFFMLLFADCLDIHC